MVRVARVSRSWVATGAPLVPELAAAGLVRATSVPTSLAGVPRMTPEPVGDGSSSVAVRGGVPSARAGYDGGTDRSSLGVVRDELVNPRVRRG